MEKRANIAEESKAKDQANRKSWPSLAEEEESKDVRVQIEIQPQDYVNQIVKSSKQAKKDKITEAYQQEITRTEI